MSANRQAWELGACELAAAFRAGSLEPTAALESVLERRAAVDPAINAVVTLDTDGARAAALASARRWREGRPLSPIDGVPVTIKDSLVVAGLRNTWGSALYGDWKAPGDELPVARLRAAGAVIVGKTNVPELTVQGYTSNPLFGLTRNPWNPALTPGGSSGGAVAAVSAGIGPLALGTDAGGSIRRPASHTGLVGLKPSNGRVPRADGFPCLIPGFEVVGPIARTTDDLIALMRILATPEPGDPEPAAIASAFEPPAAPARLRVLFVPRFGDSPVDPQIAASVAAAARRMAALGHKVETRDDFDLADGINARGAFQVLTQTGVAWLLERHPGADDKVGDAIRAMAEGGRGFGSVRYLEALQEVAALRRSMSALMRRFDVVMTPTTAALPWPAAEVYPPRIDGREAGPRAHAIFTAFVNAAGLPAITIPADPSSEGLPIGFQLIGAHGADALLCAIAREYEAAHPWAHRRPLVSPA
jgi:aspartyl-tRNA(Asn)/glutamyl-tRNA(Gln) amidotransferase subunit A